MTGKPACIPARRGIAARVSAGQRLRVINTHGSQIVDTWAFARSDMDEFMSMEHTRASLCRLNPRQGDTLVTNRRAPIVTLVEDTSGGMHDTLIAACDCYRYRYQQLGCVGYHDNCTDNLHAALREIGASSQVTPGLLNLFMNIPAAPGGALSFEPPVCRPGGTVTLRADIDLIAVFSACPQDMVPINGRAMRPTEAHFEVSEASGS